MTRPSASSRGQKTKEALLASAMEIFGRAGYDAASNRAIADAAGVNQALIGYHFGGKRGLYLAVFEHIAEQVQLEILPRLAVVRADFTALDPGDPSSRTQAVAAIELILEAMLDVLTRPDSKTWARLVMREQQDPTDAFEILYEGFMRHLLTALATFSAVADGVEQEDDTARLRAIFLASQVLVFVMAPAVVSRHMQWSQGAAAKLKMIKAQLHSLLLQQFPGGDNR